MNWYVFMNSDNVKLTKLVKTSGCAAKLAPKKLHMVIDSLPLMKDEKLIAGFESADDALIYSVEGDTVCIQTVDFFPPMVDDPYIFGQIAAANALSDSYAMGAEPNVCMNLVCFPSCLELSVLTDILRGGLDKVREAGAIIAGGHTIADPTPKYGLTVTAFTKKDKVWQNNGAREGDVLVLTKALGTGIVMTAYKAEMLEDESLYERAVRSMCTLNKEAFEVARNFEIHSATDVTGFSLLGHSMEIARGSGVTICLDSDKIPFFDGVEELAMFGLLPEGRYNNEEHIGLDVEFDSGVSRQTRDILYDPQTSGGLLLSLSEADAKAFVNEFGKDSKIIGRAVRKAEKWIYVN